MRLRPQVGLDVRASGHASSSWLARLPAADRAALRFLYEGDAYTLASGKASAVTDKSGTGLHLTASATASKRSTPRARDLHLNGAPSLFCDATQFQFVGAQVAASSAKFLHDFTGQTDVFAFMAHGEAFPQQVAGTFNGTGGNPSWGLYYDGTDERLLHVVGNGADAIVTKATANQSYPKGTLIWGVARYFTDGTFEVRVLGVVVTALSGTKTGAASSSNPTFALQLGQYGAGAAAFLGGQIGTLGAFATPISSVGVAVIESYLRTRYTNPALAATGSALPVAQLTGTVRVAFLGDSITEGKTGASLYVGGWRGRMWDLAEGDERFTLDMLGSQSDVGFDDDVHDGYSGTVPSAFLAGGAHDVATLFGSGNALDLAHVVFLMVGMNVCHGVAESVYAGRDPARDIVNIIRRVAASSTTPKRFVLCTVTPQDITVTGRSRRNIDSLNDAIKRGVIELAADGFVIGFADMFTACGLVGVSADHYHPNDGDATRGYFNMGNEGWRVLQCVAGYAPT